MDHERPPGASRDLDLRGEGPALVLGTRAVAVEVEAGLAHRDDSLQLALRLDRLGRTLIEAGGTVWVPADGGEDRFVRLRGGDGRRIRVLPQPHGEDPANTRLAGRLDQLLLGRLAEPEMGMGVDHRPRLGQVALDEAEVAAHPAV